MPSLSSNSYVNETIDKQRRQQRKESPKKSLGKVTIVNGKILELITIVTYYRNITKTFVAG